MTFVSEFRLSRVLLRRVDEEHHKGAPSAGGLPRRSQFFRVSTVDHYERGRR